jgi:F420H(2)-dependent quinone reductase
MPMPLPPRWVMRAFWRRDRSRFTRDRSRVLREPSGDRSGTLALHTVGRRSGEPRLAIVAYAVDGDRLVTLAMNGWGDTHPAWWLNLLAHPEAEVDVVGGRRAVRARAAEGAERARLWPLLASAKGWGDLSGYSAARPVVTPVVVLERR